MAKLIYNEYTQAIQELFGGDHKDIPTVSKHYKTSDVIKHGNSLKITNAKDLKNYSKIYKLKVGSGIGFGEIGLYWLFNYHKGNRDAASGYPTEEFIIMNQGFNRPDLLIPGGNKTAVEVKAYTNFKNISLGRFEDSLRDFRKLAAPMLGARSLVGEGTIDIMRLSYDDLVESAEIFCELRQAVYDNDLHKRYKIFMKMGNKFKEFDTQAAKMGLGTCIYKKNQKRPGGDHIAHQMMKWAVINATGVKPGEGGFMCNATGEKGTYDNSKGIRFFQVLGENLTDDKNKLRTGVAFKGGSFHVKFESVMAG